MKNDTDVLMFNNIIDDIGYTNIGDSSSKRNHFIMEILPEGVAKIENKIVSEDESGDLQGERKKIITPSNIFWFFD